MCYLTLGEQSNADWRKQHQRCSPADAQRDFGPPAGTGVQLGWESWLERKGWCDEEGFWQLDVVFHHKTYVTKVLCFFSLCLPFSSRLFNVYVNMCSVNSEY